MNYLKRKIKLNLRRLAWFIIRKTMKTDRALVILNDIDKEVFEQEYDQGVLCTYVSFNVKGATRKVMAGYLFEQTITHQELMDKIPKQKT